MLNVFISSTCEDLAEYRDEARRCVNAFQLEDVAMEKWGASPNPPINLVEDAIRKSDLFVGIVAWRYGSPIPKRKVSFIEYEYDYARRRHIDQLLFFADPDGVWPVRHIDKDAHPIWNFRTRVERHGNLVRKQFRTLDDFRIEFVRSLHETLQKSQGYRRLNKQQRAVIDVTGLISADLARRRTESATGQGNMHQSWFIPEISRCNIGTNYVPRSGPSGAFADWLLKRPTPYLAITGPSGIGKTNFLIAQIEHIIRPPEEDGLRNGRLVLFLPLGSAYEPGTTLSQSFERFIAQHGEKTVRAPASAFRKLIQTGDALVVLDGLDELVRTRGEGACRKLADAIATGIDPKHSAVVISCRDHIYTKLNRSTLFHHPITKRSLPPLEEKLLDEAIRVRLGGDHPARHAIAVRPALRKFAVNPLLLEMMCHIPLASWHRLASEPRVARLYELWCEEVILSGVSEEEFLQSGQVEAVTEKLGNIATSMLSKRADVITEVDLTAHGLPSDQLEVLTRSPFGILIRQSEDEWGFVHDSFREYTLARLIAADLVSKRYQHLTSMENLDYVGAETYGFLHDLFPDKQSLLRLVETAIGSQLKGQVAWNNLARNCFEAIGMIGERSAEGFIPKALDLLLDSKGPSCHRLLARTKHNLVRCLERLHRSAPQPYFRHVMAEEWASAPTENCFGAAAVRGFHQKERKIGYSHPMVHLLPNDGTNPYQEEVSKCLLGLMRTKSQDREGTGELVANCSFALIRWLHKCHLGQVKKLLTRGGLRPEIKGNLFHALLRLDDPAVLDGMSDAFAGMELSWVNISQRQLPSDFVFKHLRLLKTRESTLDIPLSQLEKCQFE